MSNNASFELRVTDHAFEQYCDRVEPIDHAELHAMCLKQLRARDYSFRDKKFIHLSGVWWVHTFDGKKMKFITCYGRTTMNIPNALKWTKAHGDRLDLKQMIMCQVSRP
ncbi:hypothetical protein [Paenibacillus elgii]|uniref:hypothetical protein n=1 Tax=Paenibacillus elgii TaxID=189691 RepID=UPI00203EEA51|nr:hypothetical protein [Paenibacillus elgii]MCM3273676.1 hypothetical protein [Paenibacillus elgii]